MASAGHTVKSSSVFAAVVLSILLFALDAAPGAEDKKTYINPREGLELEYPPGLVLKESLTPKGGFVFLLIGKTAGNETRWMLDVGLEEMEGFPQEALGPQERSFKGFAIKTALLHCDADGPDGSVYCTGVEREIPFTTDSGVKGIELYLKEVRERYPEDGPAEKEERVKGPLWAFDVSREGRARVLLVQPTEWAYESVEEMGWIKDTVGSLGYVQQR